MGKKWNKHYYSEEIKKEAVRLFLEEKKTRAQVVDILGLPYSDLVKKWVSVYRHDPNPFVPKSHGRKRKDPGEEESLKEEVKRLRMENDLLKKLRSESLKDMLAKRDIGQLNNTKVNIQ